MHGVQENGIFFGIITQKSSLEGPHIILSLYYIIIKIDFFLLVQY